MKSLKTVLLTILLLPLAAVANEPIHNTEKPKTPFIEYHNRMAVFSVLRACYERIKPNSLYAGLDAWAALTVEAGSVEEDVVTAIGEAEFRMGYNFFWNGRDHFTPVVGVGCVQDLKRTEIHTSIYANGNLIHTESSEHRKPGIAYGTVGFLYHHEFTSVFDLGFNLKGLIGGAVSNEHFDWGNPVAGFDASLPITFRFGRHRHWEYRIEPFDVLLCGQNIYQNYFGFRGGLAYRF